MLRTVAMMSLVAGTLGALTTTVDASEGWRVDPSHTIVGFEVNHLGYATVIGRFERFEANLVFDPSDPAAASLTAVIDAASIYTGWGERDGHLRSADFFDVETHPEITFTTTAINLIDADTAEVTGDLTLLGTTAPIVLTVDLNLNAPNPFTGEPTVGFSASGTLNRSDFGMEWGVPMIGDEITLRIESEAIRSN